MLAQKWQHRALRGILELTAAGKEIFFLTLTARGGGLRTPESSAQQFRRAWPLLRKRIAAKYNVKRFEFFAVMEPHRSGVLHMHVLVNVPVRQGWLKDTAFECGLGFMATSEKVEDPEIAAGYVAKYLTKSPAQRFPSGVRRVRVSQNWPDAPDDAGEGDAVVEIFHDRGAALIELGALANVGYTCRIADSAAS